MMKLLGLWICVGLSFSVAAATDAEMLAKSLFSGTKGASPTLQSGVSEHLIKKGYGIEQGKIVGAKCGAVSAKVDVKDLNADGVAEVMVLIGNECTSGKIGATIYLFTQEPDGKVQRHLGFSASGYRLLPAKNDAWPAILVQGTGGCQPVWRNKDGRYAFNNLYEETKGACSVPQSGMHGG